MINSNMPSNHSLCFDEEGKENTNAAKNAKIFSPAEGAER